MKKSSSMDGTEIGRIDSKYEFVDIHEFSVRRHFESLFHEQGENRTCLFYKKQKWISILNVIMIVVVHINIAILPFLITFASDSALGPENRPRMTPEQYKIRQVMQNILQIIAICSITLFSIDVFIRGNTVRKISFNEFEVSRISLWKKYVLSFNGICDIIAAVGSFFALFVGNYERNRDPTGGGGSITWQRGFFFLLFKSRLLFDITFPAKFGVFANRILRLGRMFVLLLITVHLCTCTWKLTVDIEKEDNRNIVSWDEVTEVYNGGIALQDGDVWVQYQTYSYHVLLLMFGENINPQTPLEKMCAFGIVMIGLLASALVVANMTYYVKVILQDSEQYHESMDNAEVLMAKLKLPGELQELVREYMKYRHRKQLMIAPERYSLFLDGLSEELRHQVMVETSRKFIEKCWLLGAFGQVPKAAARVLELLEDRVYMPEDNVVMYDDYPDGMYFIDSGILGVYSQTDELLAELGEGSFFGEIALLLNRKRSATVRALTWCDVKMLSKVSLNMVLQDLPKDVHKKITTKLTGIANARVLHEEYHEEDAVAQLNRESSLVRKQQNESSGPNGGSKRIRRTSILLSNRSRGNSVVESGTESGGSEKSTGSSMFRRAVGAFKRMKTKQDELTAINGENSAPSSPSPSSPSSSPSLSPSKDITASNTINPGNVEMVATTKSNNRIPSARMELSGTQLVGESPPKPNAKAKDPKHRINESKTEKKRRGDGGGGGGGGGGGNGSGASGASSGSSGSDIGTPSRPKSVRPTIVTKSPSSSTKKKRRKSESLPTEPSTPEGEARFNMFRGAFANRQRAAEGTPKRQLNAAIAARHRATDFGSKTKSPSKGTRSKLASL